MKRYTDYTREELVALSSAQIQDLIDLEIALAGVEVVFEPIYPQLNGPKLEKTEVGFQVSDTIFKHNEDAVKVAQMELLMTTYDYGGAGYDYEYFELVDEPTITPVQVYSKEEVKEYAKLLKEDKLAKERYDTDKSEYDKYIKSVVQYSDAVRKAVWDAADWISKKERCKAQLEKYVRLADGDVVMAKKFFEDSVNIDEEMRNAVYDEYVKEKNANSETADTDGIDGPDGIKL